MRGIEGKGFCALRGVHSMSQIQENHFQIFCKLSQRVQNIRSQLDTQEIDQEARLSFHVELESIQDQIATLNADAACTQRCFQQFEEMNGQIISLYREVEEQFERREIAMISKGASALGKALRGGKLFGVAAKVQELKHNIHFLFQRRRPSMGDRKIIHLAMQLSKAAEAAVSTQGKSLDGQLPLIQKLSTLLEEAIMRANLMLTPEEGELAMELCEIAELFEQRKLGQARMRLNLVRNYLTRAQQRRLDAVSDLPKETARALYQLATGSPCLEWDQRDETDAIIYTLHA